MTAIASSISVLLRREISTFLKESLMPEDSTFGSCCRFTSPKVGGGILEDLGFELLICLYQ